MLVKLRLNIKLEDLSFRFGLSSSVTVYPTILLHGYAFYIMFLWKWTECHQWNNLRLHCHPLSRKSLLQHMPLLMVVKFFIETPSDLFMQLSTWSQCKHHNTVIFLVACTPNGGICQSM